MKNHLAAIPNWINHQAPRNLTQSILLEESRVPGVLRTGVIIIGSLLGTFVLWSIFATVEEVASAHGQVVPSGYIQDIQHLEGGIVREILVEEGDLVNKGQILMKLDDTSANADFGQMEARQTSLKLQAERLRRFADGRVDPDSPLTSDEAAILHSMEESRSSQRNVMNDQVAQKEKELSGIQANQDAMRKNLALMQQEYTMNQKLASKGSVSRLTVMTAERELNAMKGQMAELNSQGKQAQDAISEIRSRITSLDADLRQESLKTLGQTEAELAEIDKSITKLKSASDRTVVEAPVRGIVKGLSVHTLGAVIEPGKTLMEIVPVEEDLMVEAFVSPSDAGNLQIGQPVKVKVSAYDFSRYGSIPGALKNISASTFQTEKGEAYYKAKVRLERNYVGQDSTRNMVLPGMTVQADIVTGDKTILQYLLKPIYTATQTAFRER
ncbi:MAG: HlyD family type I secretion periplasmic adaptor subunit [Pseudomonadota bacterium]